jgi:transposase-like protein
MDERRTLQPRLAIRRQYQVYLRINGDLHYLWRAVDQHGVVLDILVQERRNATAAKRFFKRLLVGLKFRPSCIVTDGLRSYGVAHREIMPDVRHRTSRYLTDVFDKIFLMGPCYFPEARVTAWPRAGLGMQAGRAA